MSNIICQMVVCFVKWGGFANGKDMVLVIADRDLSSWSSKLHKKIPHIYWFWTNEYAVF